ncbi:MAG: dienelactone hydrolase family protein [Candidatus Omnitrophica bacterium]|nr:dienelactone hydrolase family protein [Candidatus Omnitrophota bacterium]
MRIVFLLLSILALTTYAWAGLRTQSIEYKEGNTVLEGYLSYDDQFTGKRPGVLVAHEWTGLNDYVKMRADMLARLGYVAFAADIYGKGVRPQTVAEASAESSKYKNDRKLLRDRALAGLEALKAQPNVDSSQLAAIGYCFGGTAVLELARSGADLKGVVTFHGGLSTPAPEDAKAIKAQILVLHGEDDPFVPPPEVATFEKEMTGANVKFRIIKYPGAVHGFTNPANKGELKGALYNAEADKQSWEEMHVFLDRIFKIADVN